jgi:hypothetical protein
MRLSKYPIEAPYAALLIAALSIGPAAANIDMVGAAAGASVEISNVEMIAKSDSTYVNPDNAKKSRPILRSPSMRSNARGKTNGRQG